MTKNGNAQPETDRGIGKFVLEEWDLFFADGAARPVNDVEGGWRGKMFADCVVDDI